RASGMSSSFTPSIVDTRAQTSAGGAGTTEETSKANSAMRERLHERSRFPRVPGPMSLSTSRILRSVVAAIRPRGHGFDQPIDDDVLRDMQRFFPFLPWPLRYGLPLGLLLVELGPPLFARRWCRFTSMSPEDGGAYLAGFQHAGGPRAALLMGLRTLVF